MVGLLRCTQTCVICLFLCVMVTSVRAEETDRLVRVTLSEAAGQTVFTGRILVRAQDGGILLEESNGELRNLTPDSFDAIEETDDSFERLSADELAGQLIEEMGPAFGIRQTDHFVICTSASDVFTDYTAELLEKVYSEFYAFFDERRVSVQQPAGPLPVIVFRRQDDLLTHAGTQHPEQTFEDVRGYYTVRFNQMYVSDISGRSPTSRRELMSYLRKHPRHTETVVHETIHLLGYNSGLHSRLADNPLWFTEGLAAWFEPSTGRGPLLWTGPGNTNLTYVRHLKSKRTRRSLPISLPKLVGDNQAFLQSDTTLDAYAASWALVYYLLRRDRETFDQLAEAFQQRLPLIEVVPTAEQTVFAEACETPLERLEAKAAALTGRLRIR